MAPWRTETVADAEEGLIVGWQGSVETGLGFFNVRVGGWGVKEGGFGGLGVHLSGLGVVFRVVFCCFQEFLYGNIGSRSSSTVRESLGQSVLEVPCEGCEPCFSDVELLS